ncbi:maleylpyruvate isomerase N-terminal domain-containing protein [Klenkia brasiliensis]|uniref:Mycothiol maleylpyruvate isomerase N-terminal domain-containing protein n=1 Tax=Klenkia brasiliensis TaxID=333142 RepID=A0A1G7UMS0_9ACTN|nr:maleylpyruvate isomerase N-terminal domain-containing protein [Klenkia brasiliensis]SDG48658.1 Mycothiol maleylpyruvate isomerase N-terminal domain-containing protein [Klenkia brasiliensis]
MPLTFAGTLDRTALHRAALSIAPLVGSPAVAEAWTQHSVLPGMTVGGVARHLVSQVETAVEFLGIQPPPPHAPVVSLTELYRRTDWFAAPVDAPENTSIAADFDAMAAGGPTESVALLAAATAALPGALTGAGPTTYVPWQDCVLATDDFLVVRAMELLVHTDDLAAGVDLPVPELDPDVTEPALALLALLSAQQHGTAAAVRALARPERATGPAAAFTVG